MLQLPDRLLDLANAPYGSRSDFNRRVFILGQWLCGQGLGEDESVDWVLANVEYDGKPNGHRPLVTHTVSRAYEKYDPRLAGGSVPPGFADEMAALYAAVEASDIRLKAHVLALIQLAINTGHNPVNASARQLAAISGKSVQKTAEAMNKMASSLAGGVLTGVTYDGVYGHSRLWHLNPGWAEGEGYICTGLYISNPSTTNHEARFREYVEPLPMGTELTVTTVASKLGITRPRARKLLDQHVDEYFGGGFFEGERRTRRPAKWWREPQKPFCLHPVPAGPSKA